MTQIVKGTFNDCVRIDVPEGTSDPKPLCVTVDKNNCITASGGTDDGNVSSIVTVEGVLDGGATFPGVSTGLHWSIPNIGPLNIGQKYRLDVNITVMRFGSSHPMPCTNFKPFIAVNDSYSCPSGHSPPMGLTRARTMPRRFLVRLPDESPGRQTQDGSPPLDEMLGTSSICLVYDFDSSTLTEPVWKNVDSPASSGCWTLRIDQSCCVSNAELVYLSADPRYVLVPITYRCSSWRFSGQSVFVLINSASADLEAAPRTVVVEPA